MSRILLGLAAFGLLASGGAPASAQKAAPKAKLKPRPAPGPGAGKKDFDQLAKQAVRIRSAKQLGALFWARQVDCAKHADDLARRQCEGLKRARTAEHAGTTFLVDGDLSALGTDKSQPKAKTVEIFVRECVACTIGVVVDGQRQFIVGSRAAPAVKGGAVVPPKLHSATRSFKDPAAAMFWRKKVVPRLRTEFLIKLREGKAAWSKGNVSGYQVDVLGFRVFDPCDGAIVCADPPSKATEPNRRVCGKDHPLVVRTTKPKAPTKVTRPTGPMIPLRLSSHQIAASLRPARAAALKCYDIYGVQGVAKFRITIDNKGQIVGLEQTGDFTETPTGRCIEKAVRQVKFPQSRKPRTAVDYPILVR